MLRKSKRKPPTLTPSQIQLARSISHTGSVTGSENSFRSHRTASMSASQYSASGEGRVAPHVGSSSQRLRLVSASTTSQFSGEARLLPHGSQRLASTSGASHFSGESRVLPSQRFRTASSSATHFSGEGHVLPMSPLRSNGEFGSVSILHAMSVSSIYVTQYNKRDMMLAWFILR